jgi:multimeric flavodoxin WrbA
MKILLISGSPTADGSTEILLRHIGKSICKGAKSPAAPEVEFVRLNDLEFIPCQSCARSPEPEVCFYEDGLWPVYKSLIAADIVVLGSPVFFDSVSAQTKMLIDRCSCFRPPDFANETQRDFKKLGFRKRIGAGVLVAGQRGRFDLARSVMKGFFEWTEIEAVDFLTYGSPDFLRVGQVLEAPNTFSDADNLAKALLDKYLSTT